jgi:hypothetical protein
MAAPARGEHSDGFWKYSVASQHGLSRDMFNTQNAAAPMDLDGFAAGGHIF